MRYGGRIGILSNKWKILWFTVSSIYGSGRSHSSSISTASISLQFDRFVAEEGLTARTFQQFQSLSNSIALQQWKVSQLVHFNSCRFHSISCSLFKSFSVYSYIHVSANIRPLFAILRFQNRSLEDISRWAVFVSQLRKMIWQKETTVLNTKNSETRGHV